MSAPTSPLASLRSFLGPVLFGVGVWSAAGLVTVADSGSATARLLVGAPWWWLPLAIAAGALVPGFRRDARLAAPALLSTLAWWPVPLPSIALMWTGWLAWVPVALALFAGLMARAPLLVSSAPLATVGPPWRSAVAAGLLTLGLSGAAAWSLAPRLPGGDEPHYLIIAQSLLKDGDLRIENNHRSRDYAAYFGGNLDPDRIQLGRNGVIYSIHAPGLPVLVLPAFALFGYRGAEVTVMLLGAVTGGLVWYAGWLAALDRRSAWFAWAAVAGSTTFVIQSVTIFPDGPGAAIVAAAVVVLLHLQRRDREMPTRGLVGLSLGLSMLPWLHTRFSVIAAGLGALVVWHLFTERALTVARRRARIVAFACIPIVSAAAWFGFFQVLYGTPNPAAPYGPNLAETSPSYVPGGFLGLLFDEQFGLLTYSPIFAAGITVLLARRSDPRERPLRGPAIAGAIYLLGVGTYWMWWAGVPATPARFAAVVLPALAAPLSVAWRRAGATMRSIWLLLLAASLATTAVVLGVDRGWLAWSDRRQLPEWLGWLNGVVDLGQGWPSFFSHLTPAVIRSEWPFMLQVVVSVTILVLTALLVARASHRWITTETGTVLGAVLWCAIGAMAVTQAGWWLNGVSGLAPTTSQLAMLSRLARGERPLAVSAWSLGRVSTGVRAMRIEARRSERGAGAVAQWQPLPEVPAGRYELIVTTRRPTGGVLSLGVGKPRSQEASPLHAFALRNLSEQRRELFLPAGAHPLVLEPDATLASFGRRIELVPLLLIPSEEQAARASASFGKAQVYFLDDHVFVEGDGFWVRGGQSATVVVAVQDGRPVVTLALSNAAVTNAVEVSAGSFHQTAALGASGGMEVQVPVGPDGVARVRISSPGGFRPSESGASADARFLGVRVSVVEGP